MKAMILAAGRGERMRPLTDRTPKPLLLVAGKPLIAHHLIKLAKIGIDEVIINISHHAEQIEKVLGDGSIYGVKIIYSLEPTALETGGGIYQVLPLLGDEPFVVISADIWTDYPLQKLPKLLNNLAHLIMVDNPQHKTQGDFYFANGKLSLSIGQGLTYSGIGVFHPNLFQHCKSGVFRLADILKLAIAQDKISGEYYSGEWVDVGTPERLYNLNEYLKTNSNKF